MITEQERRRRKVTLRFIQVALVMLVVGITAAFFATKRAVPRERSISIETRVPASSELAPGDVQIFNTTGSVDLILRGPHMLAGLSPQTVAKIRDKMDKEVGNESGIGAAIAREVKNQVADKIGTHVQYDVADIEDIRFEDGRIIIDWKSGKEQELFGNVKIDSDREANLFRREDAERFIEAVKKRQAELSGSWRDPSVQPLDVKPLRPVKP